MTKQVIIKNKERIQYLYMLISLNIGYALCHLLYIYYSIIPPCKKKRGDVIFYPYTQPGSDGYRRRIGQYEPFFKEDGITCRICSIYNDKTIIELHEGSPAQRYRLYRKIFWIRFSQGIESSHYKSVFIQRGLFPLYPDQKFPHLEKLVYKLNENITVDFWDSVWIYNPALTEKSVKYCHRISCVNHFIVNHFSYTDTKKILFPIAMNFDAYIVKSDYKLNNPVRFIYTGNPSNVDTFLTLMTPVFSDLLNIIDFRLVLVTRHRRPTGDIKTEFFDFTEESFYYHLAGSDIGLYAIEDNDISRGKMAMKVLDYMAAGLPVVASLHGTPTGAEHGKNVLIAHTTEECTNAILLLCKDGNLRNKLGQAGRKVVESEHNIKDSYLLFKTILFDNQNYFNPLYS